MNDAEAQFADRLAEDIGRVLGVGIAIDDIELVRELIEKHVRYTGSDHGARVLEAWSEMAALFVKVMPRDYKRVLAAQTQAATEGRPVAFSELVGVAVAHG